MSDMMHQRFTENLPDGNEGDSSLILNQPAAVHENMEFSIDVSNNG